MNKRAKQDVRCCLETWTEILQGSLGDGIEYAYSKGSAIKPWDSPIDYVPIISDVDIHVRLADESNLIPKVEDPLSHALETSRAYERTFLEKNPEHLHIPRTQIVILNDIEKDPNYVPPCLKDVKVLFGEPDEPQAPPDEVIRRIDLRMIESQESFLNHLPPSLLDRSGLEYWETLRQMSWRVGPSPVRLITQVHPDPMEVWSWNRTRIWAELRRNGSLFMANSYKEFYEAGWRLFRSGFQNPDEFRTIIWKGYNVLKTCLEVARGAQH